MPAQIHSYCGVCVDEWTAISHARDGQSYNSTRWRFSGAGADETIREKYVRGDVSHYVGQNPVRQTRELVLLLWVAIAVRQQADAHRPYHSRLSRFRVRAHVGASSRCASEVLSPVADDVNWITPTGQITPMRLPSRPSDSKIPAPR
jgi:hypothetical protein